MSAAQEITPRIAPPSTIKATLRPSSRALPLRQRRARSLINSIVFRGFTPKIVALMRCSLLSTQQFAFQLFCMSMVIGRFGGVLGLYSWRLPTQLDARKSNAKALADARRRDRPRGPAILDAGGNASQHG